VNLNRMLIVEDDQSLLASLRDYFEVLGYQVHEAAKLSDALALIDDCDVVLTDLQLSESPASLEGLQIARAVRLKSSQTLVLLFTGKNSASVEREAVSAGVDEILEKPMRLRELAESIIRVRHKNGKRKMFFEIQNPELVKRLPSNLTLREREVALRAAAGNHNQDIARALSLSEQTVKNHLSSVFRKLQVRNRIELALTLHEPVPGVGSSADLRL
jgi:DNA-binding NarL/FixJ family response regulator